MHDQSSQIFISYTTADQDRVLPFFDALEKDGFNIWIDCKRLKPGQDWDFEIKRALDKSSLVIVFLSEATDRKRGYVQREFKLVLDKLSEKLVGDIYIIPILLDEAQPIPEQFKGIHCISAHEPDCISRVSEALTFQLNKLGLATQRIQHKEEITWAFKKFHEEWDGLPGYEIELLFVTFHSTRYAGLKSIGDYIRGELLKYLFAVRAKKLSQDPSLYNHGQDKLRRSDTFDLHCSEPTVVGKVLTIQYAIHWYNAGAAHGNMSFVTYSFVMEPLCLIEDISSIFNSLDDALPVLQDCVRRALSTPEFNITENMDWVKNGTKEWGDFSCFAPNKDGIKFLFPPYQVASYAQGLSSRLCRTPKSPTSYEQNTYMHLALSI